MGFFDQFVAQFRPSMENSSSTDSIPEKDTQGVSGVAKVEALQMVWGKNGKYLLWTGLALMMIIFELDNSTVYNYQTFATSSFNQLSLLAAIQTCQTIVSAVMNPPIAKISDVIGRGETYIFTITCYLLSYFLCASSTTVNVYAGGAVFYAIGQTGTQVLDQIIISDISTARWRGFAIVQQISYFPFLITPWVSAFIVDSVVGGIGWGWGIGMFAILMPFCASFIIVTLLYYQRKAGKAGIVVTKRITIYDFCSLIDLGGVILLSGGFAMLLLPISLAATTPSRWQTPYLDALMGLGVAFLIALIPYEHWVAKHPVLPLRYLRNATIVLSLYAWSIVSHNYSVRDATFLVYTNGVVQCLVGIAAGWIMYKTRRYKYLNLVGVIIRVIGYGIMMRLRGQNNSTAELFIVQCIQGIGSGIIQTIIVVSAQVVVSHAELAQISSLVLLMSFLGSAIGQAIAGGIYTNTFRDRLRVHLPNASDDTIESLFNSITGILPDWGTNDRFAANSAYSDVMRYITIAALVVGGPMILLALILPNVQLTDRQNIFEDTNITDHKMGVDRAAADLPEIKKEKGT
ncbi:MFS general substrate transporter [Dendrothele bispora CBS 962.96]|uniref:MFS general substrate transporter n=1 Tax=Dendrothele bispora (strain CBS 962.96) TaxID=1314807 RepID=A0A4S8L259_DENBC|nr:MFS general substrate transporter [Dendrothele bispora CBS 962.96]